MELGLEILELVHLALHHLGDRHARPLGDHVGDLLGRDLLLEDAAGLLLLRERLGRGVVVALERGDGRVAQLGGLGEVAVARGALHLALGVLDLGLEVLDVVDGLLLVLPVGLHAVKLLAGGGYLAAQLL